MNPVLQCSVSEDKVQGDLDPPKELIYEEIGDVKDSFTYTQNVLYGQSLQLSTGTTFELTSALSHDQEGRNHEYELIAAVEGNSAT